MAEPYKRTTRYPGLKERERLQKKKAAEAKRAKKAAEAKKKAEAAEKAKKPFNPGRSGIRMTISEAEEVEFNPQFSHRRPNLERGSNPPPSVSKRGKYTGPITTAEDFKLIGGVKKLKRMKPRKR